MLAADRFELAAKVRSSIAPRLPSTDIMNPKARGACAWSGAKAEVKVEVV